MNTFIKKVLNVFENKIGEIKHGLYLKRIQRNTIKLKENKKSDYRRWKNSKELLEAWNERTSILATMVKSKTILIEFGAGNMSLKKMLPEGCSYTPSDIYARTPEILVCDLNENIPFDLTKYDTAVFSGVLEYVYDVDKVFRQLSNSIDNIVLSYACSDISKANRLKSGWLSDYSKLELEVIFEKYDYQIVEYKEWRNQSIFSLRKALEKLS